MHCLVFSGRVSLPVFSRRTARRAPWTQPLGFENFLVAIRPALATSKYEPSGKTSSEEGDGVIGRSIYPRCLDHHPEGYRLLVQQHQTPLACYLSRRLSNRDEAAEAARETFVRAYFALKSLRNREAFFSWLLGIADRVVKEMVRAAQRRRAVECHDLELAAAAVPRSDREAELNEAVARLLIPYREIIVLRNLLRPAVLCGDQPRPGRSRWERSPSRLSRAYSC